MIPSPSAGDAPAATGVEAVVAGYPGPALRLIADGAVVRANAAARALLEADAGWWPAVDAWRGEATTAPSLLVVAVAGGRVVEWAAVPLPDGGALLLGRDVTAERRLRAALTESRERYRDLVRISSDFAWETGPDGSFVFVSSRGALGHAAAALVGHSPSALIAEGWGDAPLPFATRRPLDGVELWLRTADGGEACVEVRASPLTGPDGSWRGARGVCRDVTEARRRAAALSCARTREKLIGHIVRTLRDEVDATHALQVAAEGTTRALGAEGCRINGVDAGGGLVPLAGFGPEPADVAGEGERLVARTQHRHVVNGAVAVWRAAGAGGWSDDDRALLEGVADQLGVVQAQIAYQRRLRTLSERDELTGLLNRRTVLERLEARLSDAGDRPAALLYLDLDHFKAVNDMHGHRRGDAVLRTLGDILRRSVRAGDLPARLGGDEFVLWLDDADEAGALTVADRLLADSNAALTPLSASPELPLGLSIGIAAHRPGTAETIEMLFERADAAMYQAKQRGKGGRALAPPAVTP